MIFSSMYMDEHESSICDYKGPTMFDLGLLRTLGQVWVSFRDFLGPLGMICVSLGTSQVHWYLFGFTMSLFGL